MTKMTNRSSHCLHLNLKWSHHHILLLLHHHHHQKTHQTLWQKGFECSRAWVTSAQKGAGIKIHSNMITFFWHYLIISYLSYHGRKLFKALEKMYFLVSLSGKESWAAFVRAQKVMQTGITAFNVKDFLHFPLQHFFDSAVRTRSADFPCSWYEVALP